MPRGKITAKELTTIRSNYILKHQPYKLTRWNEFNYSILANVMYSARRGRGTNQTVNEAIIMCDTETSKKVNSPDNHIVAWTMSIRWNHINIVTLYGNKPSEFIQAITKVNDNLCGYETYYYWHNLAYDWQFIRKFMFKAFGLPAEQLNTKPHYPIAIKWNNGITFKDSLILAQRSLDKWAKDMQVCHQKAIGKWDYDKLRNQDEEFTADELEYIEHDTLAGVECIDALLQAIGKQNLYSIPFTATGIPRADIRAIGSKNKARDRFKRMAMDYADYCIAEMVFHGGFTHANRYLIDVLIDELVEAFDFSSSYPYVVLSERYPIERFSKLSDKPIQYILDNAEDYAFMFKLILVHPVLKDLHEPMPVLQFSKCIKSINAILDNGRVLEADYIEIYITEIDLQVINSMYNYEKHICTDIRVATKGYLPRWFTDYIYQLYSDKCTLKGKDKVQYAIAKAKLNAASFGMMVQHSISDDIKEVYDTGDYVLAHNDPEEMYQKYLEKRSSILLYQQGIWITAYALRNLFQLGRCCDTWVYSDTDSCYGIGWHKEEVEAYNNQCKQKLLANSYAAVEYEGREYWPGIAEHDPEADTYTEFKVLGAKRYCGRCKADNDLHITVAGVPKRGASCLNNDINNFTRGFIFPGSATGKLTHYYNYVDDIYIDDNGNETGDSIDLQPCDYLLDAVAVDWDYLEQEEIKIQIYEED